MKLRNNPFIAATMATGLLAPWTHAAVQPYTADADTVYLLHLNEAALSTSAANLGSAGFSAIAFDGNPAANHATNPQATNDTILGAAAFAGFGSSANISAADLGLGVDANASGGFQMGVNGAASPDAVLQSSLAAANGSFTMEAMLNLPAITGPTREIICTDNSVGTRGFQFRVNATGNLEFNFIGTAPAAYLVPIPTSGTHAFVSNEWFHVALTHDATTSTTIFYWTRVSTGITTANPIGTPSTTETVLGTVSAPLVFGNEARSAGGGVNSNEGILGLIDEIRISKVVRGASQFIFFDSGNTDGDNLPDDWEILHFRENESETVAEILAKFGDDGNPDGDSANNLAEYTAGSDPNNILSVPGDIDGDSLQDSWEITHFTVITAQDGSGDPDGDFATNEDEETAVTDPSGADGFLSFPDTEGGIGDGLSDAWEMFYFSDLDEIPTGDPDGDLYTNAEEYPLLTHPADQLSAPDGDADGLNDGWEAQYFFVSGDDRPTLLARQSGTTDADSDGYNNDSEETAVTNPTTSQKPSDTDADGLIDSWEIAYFGDLSPLPGDTAGDADGATNLQEQNAGSDPTVTASIPTDIDGDSILDSAEVFQPYTADSNTLHLWHLDEVDQPAADAGSGALVLGSVNANGRMWAPSSGGFGTGLNPSAGRGTTTGGVLSALPLANGTADDVTTSYAGTDGAFTFEAIVRIDFDPLVAPASVVPMQILTGENDAGATRVWQFRLVPIGGPGNLAGTSPLVEFINLRGEVGIQSLVAPLPTGADPDAIVQGGWYHVAVAYNGAEASPSNVKFYWTLLDPARTAANEVFAGQMTNDLILSTPDLSIGNEARDLGGFTDSFLGVVDEVRVSSVARHPGQFLFKGADGDTLDDAWELPNFGDLDEIETGDFDNDGTDNLSEFRLGLTPNSGSSRFFASGGAGGTFQWPGVAGVTFTIERSTMLANDWIVLNANYPGAAGTTSFTDPAPPVGKAFYKVTLNP